MIISNLHKYISLYAKIYVCTLLILMFTNNLITIIMDEYLERKISQQEFYRDIELEMQYFWYHCLIKPEKHEKDDFLKRFANLEKKDQMNAVLESKNWGDATLTKRMQQILF